MHGQDHQDGHARVRHVPIQVESRSESRGSQRHHNRGEESRHHQQGHYDDDYEYQQERNHHQQPFGNHHQASANSNSNTSSININYKPSPPQRQSNSQQHSRSANNSQQHGNNSDQSTSPSLHGNNQQTQPTGRFSDEKEGSKLKVVKNRDLSKKNSSPNTDKLVSSPEPIPLPPPEQHHQQQIGRQQSSTNQDQNNSNTNKFGNSTSPVVNNDIDFAQQEHQQQTSHVQANQKQSDQRGSSVLDKINSIKHDVSNYLQEIIKFDGISAKSKDYRYLDEMLTRCMLNLDNIDCSDSKELRLMRKSTIKLVDKASDVLQRKLQINCDIHTLSESMAS